MGILDGNDFVDGGDLRYGKLVVVDFSKYVKNEGSVQIRMDDKFDSNKDFIEKISVISKTKMVCVHMTGRIVIKEMLDTSDTNLTCIDVLDIPCPGKLKEDLFDDDEDDSDSDGPNLCTSNQYLSPSQRSLVADKDCLPQWHVDL